MREIYFIIREREFKNYIHTNIFRWKYITAIHGNYPLIFLFFGVLSHEVTIVNFYGPYLLMLQKFMP